MGIHCLLQIFVYEKVLILFTLGVGLMKLVNLVKISCRLDKGAFCAYCLVISGHEEATLS